MRRPKVASRIAKFQILGKAHLMTRAEIRRMMGVVGREWWRRVGVRSSLICDITICIARVNWKPISLVPGVGFWNLVMRKIIGGLYAALSGEKERVEGEE